MATRFSSDDPFASAARRRSGNTSVLDEFEGTELAEDPFEAAAVRRERMTPRPRKSMGALSRLITGEQAPKPLSVRDRLFNVSIPEQLMGSDEDIRGFEESLAELPETLYPTRERDENFSFGKAALAETVPNFFQAIRSAGSPVGLLQNAAGRVGRAANVLMAGEGVQQMREGNFWGGLTNTALSALGALAGTAPARPQPRPVPKMGGPKPEGFAPQSTSPLDEAFADRVFAESKQLGDDYDAFNAARADEILGSSKELGLDAFDYRTGKLRDDLSLEELLGRGFTRDQVLAARSRPTREMSYPPAEAQARRQFEIDNPDTNVQGGVRTVQGEVVDDPFAALTEPSRPVLGTGDAPSTDALGSSVPSAEAADLVAARRQLQREGYPPALIDRILGEMQAGRATPKYGRVEPTTTPPVVEAAPLSSEVSPAPPADPLEELLGPILEQEPAPFGGTTPVREGYTGPERRGAGRMSQEDWLADQARRRQTEIQERMQAGTMSLEDTISKRPDADMKAAGEAARIAQAELEGRPKGRVDSGRGSAVAGERPPDGPQEPPDTSGGRVELPRGPADRPVGGAARPGSPEDAYFDELLRGARERGYAGTDDELRSLFDDNVRSSRELIQDLEQISGEFGPEALLAEIRKRGGIRSWSVDADQAALGTRGRRRRSYGDLKNMVEAFEMNRGQRGASSIFRETGTTPDDLAASLAEMGWPGIADMDDLLETLERIAASKDDTSIGWGAPRLVDALSGQGIRPDVDWWNPNRLDDSFDFGANAADPLDELQLLDDVGPNASGESAASAEALSRQSGMAARGERFVVYDRAGRARPLVGPDAVDYVAQPGETYGVETPQGFRVLDDKGGVYQRALPGAEAARTAAVATPEVAEVPFSLQREVVEDPLAEIESLFAADDFGTPLSAADQGLDEVVAGGRVQRAPEDLTVYHGTPEAFESFDPDAPTFFSENPEVASRFAEGSKKAQGNAPRVIPARIRAESVLDVTGGPMEAADAQRLGEAFGMQPAAAMAQFERAVAQRDWRMIRSWLEKAGFDALRFSYRGEDPAWMLTHPRQATSTSGAPLYREGAPAGVAPRANKIPTNVRDFLVKQLGYTDADLAAMAPSEIYRLGREKVRNPNAAPRAERPRTVKTAPEGTPYPESLAESPIAEDLERFLEVDVPARQAQAAARTERARQSVGVPMSRVNQPGARSIAPAVRQPVEAPSQVTTGRQPVAGESLREAQSRKAKMQGDQKRAGRKLDEAFDSGDYKGFAQQLGDMVDRYWQRTNKMGTGAADLRRGDTGTVLESGLVPGFSMASKILKDPAKYAALSREMLANPGIRAVVGGLTGYAVDDEEPLRGALYGAIAASAGPSGARALARSIRNLREGKPATPFQDPKNRDVARWRLAYGPSLEASVPDVYRKVKELESQLQAMYQGAWSPETKVATAKHTRVQVGKVLADAAKEAKDAGLKRKAWLLEGYARRYRGAPTMGQQNIQTVADKVFGKGTINAAEIERHANQLIHRTMIGYALDSAAQNLTQPTLALLWVSPRNLGRGWKAARSAAGKKITEHLTLPAYKGQDIVSEAEELLTGKTKQKETILSEPGFPLRMTDEFNRRSVYLAALAEKGWLDKALGGATVPKDVEAWAVSKMNRTQGNPGVLGKNPFHRGPVAGPLGAFQKYPGLFLENLADAFNDKDARGKAAVASLLGLVAAGHIMGIDVAEMYFSGARPLGIDPLHPEDAARRGLTIFPAVRGVSDAVKHLAGTADHPFVGTPGKDFLEGDVATLTMGRYPVKVAKKGGEILREGLGTHQPESVTDTRVPHTGMEDLANLVGLRSERQTEAGRAGRDAARFRERAQREQREATQDKRRALEEALRSGNRQAVERARRAMSPAQLRDFERRRKQTPYERRREQIPKNRRDEFDELFRDQLDRR